MPAAGPESCEASAHENSWSTSPCNKPTMCGVHTELWWRLGGVRTWNNCLPAQAEKCFPDTACFRAPRRTQVMKIECGRYHHSPRIQRSIHSLERTWQRMEYQVRAHRRAAPVMTGSRPGSSSWCCTGYRGFSEIKNCGVATGVPNSRSVDP